MNNISTKVEHWLREAEHTHPALYFVGFISLAIVSALGVLGLCAVLDRWAR